MHSNSLIPLIYKPTRETKTTVTLIDNIFTNNYNVNDLLLQGLLITDISDHYAIFHIWDKNCLETDKYQLIRLTNESRMVRYKENINSIDWTALDQYNSCEVYFTHFFNKIKSVNDESFPITKVKKGYRNRIPWLTSGLRESIKHKTNSIGCLWNIPRLIMKHCLNNTEIWPPDYLELKKNSIINLRLKQIEILFGKLGWSSNKP